MNSESTILTHSMPFIVRTESSDMYKRLRPGAMLAYLIQSSIQHAEKLEAGFDTLSEQNLFWVLSRFSIEIRKPVLWHQEARSETWPKNLEKIMYLRDFQIIDQNDEVLVNASSGWLAIDKLSKRPKILDRDYSQIFTALKDKHALEALPEKLLPVKEGEITETRATYFDIDLNGHVTSSRYIDWMMDSFSAEFQEHHYPKRISINYLNETKINDSIQLKKIQASEHEFLFEGFNTSKNCIAFLGKIGF